MADNPGRRFFLPYIQKVITEYHEERRKVIFSIKRSSKTVLERLSSIDQKTTEKSKRNHKGICVGTNRTISGGSVSLSIDRRIKTLSNIHARGFSLVSQTLQSSTFSKNEKLQIKTNVLRNVVKSFTKDCETSTIEKCQFFKAKSIVIKSDSPITKEKIGKPSITRKILETPLILPSGKLGLSGTFDAGGPSSKDCRSRFKFNFFLSKTLKKSVDFSLNIDQETRKQNTGMVQAPSRQMIRMGALLK